MYDSEDDDLEEVVSITKEDVQRKRDEVLRIEKELQKGDAELRQRTKSVVQLRTQVKEVEREVKGKENELMDMNMKISELMVGIREMDEQSDKLREEILQVEEESKAYMHQKDIEIRSSLIDVAHSAWGKAQETQEAAAAEETLGASGNRGDELPPLVEGVVEVIHENSACFFQVPHVHTFGDLLNDSIKYWNLQIEKVGLEDDEGRVWASRARVWNEMVQTERYKSKQVPQVYLRFKELEEAEEEEEGDWMTKKKKEAIEIVKEMDEAEKLRQEETARLRSQTPVSYTHLRAHETPEHLVCRLLLEKKKNKNN
eukprot:TRINITY_DN2034_c0_g1_i2.p1 TRINITY_DN2034_c0_g1~~TRINITY_DN2034_c0_g1_i2.p1  ORF type:complete len:314 (-),score=131.11 TRINITY_DN2034_c0_g1_i2:80-1021(-)